MSAEVEVTAGETAGRERDRMESTSSRTDRAVRWAGWHLPELSGVTLPLAGAWAFSPWCAVLSGLIGLGWVWHETRQHRAGRSGDVRGRLAENDTGRRSETGAVVGAQEQTREESA